jgi:hypothetical protein
LVLKIRAGRSAGIRDEVSVVIRAGIAVRKIV